MLTRKDKERQVDELRKALEGVNALIAVDYRGLSVKESNDLRGRLRSAGEGSIRYRVAKNNLVRRAIDGTEVAGFERYLVGPTALAIAYDEPAALAKTLVDYAKQNEKFEIRGGIVEGDLVELEQIRALAALPGKDELRAMLAGTLQAPLRNLAGTLMALLGHTRNALEQRAAQLEAES